MCLDFVKLAESSEQVIQFKDVQGTSEVPVEQMIKMRMRALFVSIDALIPCYQRRQAGAARIILLVT